MDSIPHLNCIVLVTGEKMNKHNQGNTIQILDQAWFQIGKLPGRGKYESY